MTAKQRITGIIGGRVDMESDSMEKLIYLAYYMGRESVAKEVSDKYTAHIKEQKARANECRYHVMAAQIVGKPDYIYSSDYSGEMTATFGSDETAL